LASGTAPVSERELDLRVAQSRGRARGRVDSELVYEGRVVGRVTSAVRDPEGGLLALADVHTEVPEDAELGSS
jgi:hypothetical protein